MSKCDNAFGAIGRSLAHRDTGSQTVQNEGSSDALVGDHWLHVEQVDERE
jgi:hypothetical protein